MGGLRHSPIFAYFYPHPLAVEVTNRYDLTRNSIVYTRFEEALIKITRTEAGSIEIFINVLQEKLDEKLGESPPIAPILGEILEQ